MTTNLDASQTCDALYAAGFYFLERQRIEDAAALFRAMLLADAEDERGWLALGACHEQLDQGDMAADLYGAGAQIARTRVRLFVAISQLFTKLGDDRAEEALDTAASLTQTDEEEALVHAERMRTSS